MKTNGEEATIGAAMRLSAPAKQIRAARAADVPQLLRLMHQLAIFEGYSDRFAVDEPALLERGFAADRRPEFAALVAEDGDCLVGYAVTYMSPFTFDLRPTLVLKELFVSESVRGKGIGQCLLAAVLEQARGVGARLLRWQVLPDNEAAMRLYRSIGAGCDTAWQHWVLEL